MTIDTSAPPRRLSSNVSPLLAPMRCQWRKSDPAQKKSCLSGFESGTSRPTSDYYRCTSWIIIAGRLLIIDAHQLTPEKSGHCLSFNVPNVNGTKVIARGNSNKGNDDEREEEIRNIFLQKKIEWLESCTAGCEWPRVHCNSDTGNQKGGLLIECFNTHLYASFLDSFISMLV